MEKISELKKDLEEQREVLNSDWADAETKKFAKIAMESIEAEIKEIESMPPPAKQTPKDKAEIKKVVATKYKALRKARKIESSVKKSSDKKQTPSHNVALDKARKALHAGKRTSASGNTYYEYRMNRADNDRRVRLKDGGEIWKDYDFDNLYEFFDYIDLSRVNGNFSQMKRLWNELSKEQQREFFKYAREIGYDESITWINEKFENGGGVKHSKKLDKKRKAKPEGWRYKGKNKANPKYYKRPTSEEIQKKSKRIYLERRKSKSDNNQSKKI